MNTKINAMRPNPFRSFLGLAVVCLALALGHSLLADLTPSAALLVKAYSTLEQANKDYKGHRIAAMKQIEAAANLLGVKVKGDGKGREKQSASDTELSTAQGLLQQALPELSGKALKHVDKAMQELSIALSMKQRP
jgi:hypothetical protein